MSIYKYDSTQDELIPLAGGTTASSSIFVGTAAEWAAETDKTDFNAALITDAGTVNAVDDTTGDTEVVANKNVVFKGTLAEWEALTTAQKKTYDEAFITNDMDTGEVVDAVTDGDMRAVTSNAVYDTINNVSYGSISGISCTSGTVDSAYYAKNGKIITLSIHLDNCTLTTSGLTTLHLELPNTIPRPPFTVHGAAAYFNNDTDKTGHCKLQNSGSIIVYSDREDDGMEGLHVWLSLTYISI